MQRLTTLGACLITTAVAFGQTAQTSAPSFDVASIKPAAPGQRGRLIRGMPGGRLNMTNMPLKDMVQIAYKIQPFQITGGPAWFDSEPWDIMAKPDSDPGPNQIPLMLQSLLADRFALKFHRETKEQPVYAMVVGKPGDKTPGLTESKEGSCTAPDPSAPLPPMPQPGQAPSKRPCGMMMMGFNRLDSTSQTLDQLATMLSRTLGRPVIDNTGLKGKYDIHLEWTPDPSQVSQMQPPPPGAPPPPTFDPNGPSIFTAIQEQLGLKLESQKGPVEVFVIDHAEKPTEN